MISPGWEEGKLKPDYADIEIGEIFLEIEHMFSAEAARNSIRLTREVKDVPVFRADRGLLVRILENLVSNAIRSIPFNRQGLIAMKAVFDKTKKRLVISVIDNGYGIPEKYLGKIFEKFEQVRMRKEGSQFNKGLGLTFCRLAIEAHGGRIDVKSREGRGSEFIFTLPA